MVQDVKLSQEYSVNAGVQSSVLGPTLFLLYIDDLPDDVTCNIVWTPLFYWEGLSPPPIFQDGDSVFDTPMHTMCNIAIYADDTILYSKCDQASDLWQQLELATGL